MADVAPATADPYLRRLSAAEAPATAQPVSSGPQLTWAKARGTRVWDMRGREYLDLTAGAGVSTVGHSHPRVVDAVRRQAGELIHTGWQWASPQRVALLERLREIVPGNLDTMFIGVTGAEAVEIADKLARLHTGRRTVLSFRGGYHGKTAGALRLSTQRGFRHDVLDRGAGDLRLYFPGDGGPGSRADCLALNEDLLRHPDFDRDDVAAIIVEPVQGVAGMVVPPPGFLPWLRAMCDEIGALLIVDEIYTGFGRTGLNFAVEHASVVPDILILGKALGGGLPISVVAANRAIAESMGPSVHTGTFAGSPLSCAAGLAVLEVLEEEKLAANAAARGAELRAGLAAALPEAGIATVRGLGLMVGVELLPDSPPQGRALCAATARIALDNGVLLFTGGTRGNCLKLTPPLVMDDRDCELAVSALSTALREARRR
jgi:4-aminobutyrate aminotransferase-like enzyme